MTVAVEKHAIEALGAQTTFENGAGIGDYTIVTTLCPGGRLPRMAT